MGHTDNSESKRNLCIQSIITTRNIMRLITPIHYLYTSNSNDKHISKHFTTQDSRCDVHPSVIHCLGNPLAMDSFKKSIYACSYFSCTKPVIRPPRGPTTGTCPPLGYITFQVFQSLTSLISSANKPICATRSTLYTLSTALRNVLLKTSCWLCTRSMRVPKASFDRK